jgi:hypothetical protein
MKRTIILGLAVVVLFAGCGDDEQTAQFTGLCVDFESKAPVPGCKVLALDNDTGEPLPGMEAIAAGDGLVLFDDLEPGLVAFKAVGVRGESEDTYSFNFFHNDQKRKVYLVSFNTVAAGTALAELEWDRTKGVAAGSVYWYDGEILGDGEEIGCATVKTDPLSGDERYFNDGGMPTTLDKRSNTNPNNSYFLYANIDPGRVKVRGYMDGTEFGQSEFLMFADSICISDIYVNPDNSEFTDNPTPADCE